MSTAQIKRPLTIRPLRNSDIDAVIEIHAEQFPKSRTTFLGKPFVRKMYNWFLRKQPDLSVVGAIDSKPVGFAICAIGGMEGKSLDMPYLKLRWV